MKERNWFARVWKTVLPIVVEDLDCGTHICRGQNLYHDLMHTGPREVKVKSIRKHKSDRLLTQDGEE